jgi:hypothetical protein
LAAIPSAATSTFSLIAFALAIAAYVFIVWRVIRNKNLLQHLQKLPPKDRLGALETELGGQLLAAPNETWAKAITGNDADEVQVRPGEEAVYAFKDEKPATFAKFSILVDSSYGGNVKELEIFVSDESPVGSFRSIGKFTAQNLRVIKSPYQEFTFPETTAKYLKIKVLSNYGVSPMGSTFLKQIRLIGRPAT